VKAFFDTNILVYAMTEDARGSVARERSRDGGAVSTQVLNEFVRVARKKLKLGWTRVETALRDFRGLVGPIRGIVVSTHEAAVALARHMASTFTTRSSSPLHWRLDATRC
jgi:predicted nucleic acid-binding protein